MFDKRAYWRERNQRNRRDAFYIFTHSYAPSVCKAGSTGWVNIRLSTLKGAFPYGTVDVAYVLETPHYRTIEKMVRDKFKKRKLNGDWLDATPAEVISYVHTIPLVGGLNAANDNGVVQASVA